MSIMLAQLLYKLFGITTTLKNGHIIHTWEFFK